MEKIVIDSLVLEEIENLIAPLGEPKYRAKQIYSWIYNKKIRSFEEMSNLSKELRTSLSDMAEFTVFKELKRTVSQMDGSIKLLFELGDGERIESVLLRDGDRITGCVSTQVGCKMGCRFCSTAKIGYKRDLSVAEILNQVRELELICKSEDASLTNIVFMGMGEPLDNFANLVRSLAILRDEDGFGYSHRRITVSTLGLSSKLRELFKIDDQINIAVSINAPTQGMRASIMPATNKFKLDELISTLHKLPLPKRKRITIEYVMLGGINDSLKDAEALYNLISRLPVKINLIRYNGGGDDDLIPPKELAVLDFQKYLIDKDLSVFVRKSLGADIFGACGQLAAEYKKK